jgi:hypothetical protein
MNSSGGARSAATYITRKDYEFASERGITFRQPYTDESGSHHLDGILIAAGPAVQKHTQPITPTPQIPDITSTILHLMDCAIPKNLDGLVLESLFTNDFINQHPVQFTDDISTGRQDEHQTWNAEEEAEVMERLKKLGYLN